MRTRTAPRRLAALLAVLLVAGACGTAVPSATPAPTTTPTQPPVTAAPTVAPSARPLAEVYAEIRTQVAGIRGLVPTAAVDPVVIDAAQLATNLTGEFDAAYTADALKDAEDELIALGLLPPGSSLRALTLAFQGGQVAGYYSPDKDELFVVSRTAAVGPADESTYAHEFTHQLQDQHVDLDKLGIDTVDQSDQALARLALVEGDATSVQTTWMTQNLTPAELGEVFAASLDPAALEAFNNAPEYLRETALFPYQSGLTLVLRLIAQGGYDAVDAAFADPPDSTEQILHPEKYVDREAPVIVEVPRDLAGGLGAGWKEVAQDTLGELILRTWLKVNGVSNATALTAAAGWGGDRLAIYRGPDGALGLYLRTAWDSPLDADEFAAAAGDAVGNLALGGAVVHAPELTIVEVAIGSVRNLIGS
jgi:hypothetical protein